jgi:hypothetical protein
MKKPRREPTTEEKLRAILKSKGNTMEWERDFLRRLAGGYYLKLTDPEESERQDRESSARMWEAEARQARIVEQLDELARSRRRKANGPLPSGVRPMLDGSQFTTLGE